MKNLFGSLLDGTNTAYERVILRVSLVLSISGNMGMQSVNRASVKIIKLLIEGIEICNFKS